MSGRWKSLSGTGTVVFLLALLYPVVDAWWEAGNFYQIYPRSFQDSDGDGIGDINGISTHLEYLVDIGITATWLSPIFKSPMADFGYDTGDYYQIQADYGTMEDFDQLIAHAQKVGIRIILDFVPNHTSNLNEWFIKSENRDPTYKDFYVWHDGKIVNGVRQPPNNWVSVFRGSAWTWSEKRQQFYLHQFLKEQPDLNYRNPAVVEEMKNVLRFWLNRGVSGFRIDAVPYLFEVAPDLNGNYPDEELTGSSCPNPADECYTIHTLTQNMDETFDMVYQWRSVLMEYKDEEKVLMIEAYTPLENVMRLYGNDKKIGAQIPFNFELISHWKNQSTTQEIYNIINTWLVRIPKENVSNWVLGNHDNKRSATKYGVQRVDLINTMLQTLPGVAVTYYGEELGLEDVPISWANTIDPAGCNTNETIYENYSRDPCRTPMPWNANKNGGFSSSDKTWLPVSSDYMSRNVQQQLAAQNSHLKIFKRLTELRRNEAALKSKSGTTTMKVVNDVLIYLRKARYGDALIIALNFGGSTTHVDIKKLFPNIGSAKFMVEVASISSDKAIGTEFDQTITLNPYEALVLRGSTPNVPSRAARLTGPLGSFFW